MTPFHACLLVNNLQFEIVKMMTYDLWNLKFSHRNQFDRFLSLELIKVPSRLRTFFNKPLRVADHQKVFKLWKLPDIKIFTPNVNTLVPIFVHSYRFQKDKDGQSIWMKVGKCYWEHLGIHSVFDGNKLRLTRIQHPWSPPSQEGKNQVYLVHDVVLHRWNKICILHLI